MYDNSILGKTLSCKTYNNTKRSKYATKNTKKRAMYLTLGLSKGSMIWRNARTNRTIPTKNILKPRGKCNVVSSAIPVKIVKNIYRAEFPLFHKLIETRRNMENVKRPRNICSKNTVKTAPHIAKRKYIIVFLHILLTN